MKTIANLTLLISLCVFLTFTLLSQKPGSSTRISERVLQSAGNIVSPSAGQDSSGEDADDTQYIHSLVNVIVWGLLADIAIIIVRFFRGTNLRIWRFSISMQAIHGILMIAVIASSVAATIQLSGGSDDEQGQNQSNTDIKEHNDDGPDKDFHSTVGTIMFVLMALTVCLGLIGYLIIIPYNKKRRPILVVKRLHQVFGTILYLCAKANVITGAILYADGDWQIPVFAGLGALALIHIVLQALYSYKFHFANKASPTREFSKKSIHIALIDVINKGIPREDIIATFPNLKWVMLGNKVYDLTGWIHPGGNFMIEACVGREVGRYFFGNIALEGSKIAPHKHSALTLSQMQKFCIGEVTNCESVLIVKSGKEEIISSPSRKWKIVATINSSPTVSEIRFHCPDFQFKNFGTSLSWLGRHYCLSQDTNRSLARLYTTAFSLSNSNCNLRQSIFKYFEDVMNGAENSMFSYDSNYLLPQDSLPLYIKSYPRGFSNLVHKTDIGHHSNQFRVEGPQGRGLELTPSSTGAHYIICAGTGVLPFVDFLNLFLWKTMYTLIKQKAGAEKAEKINILQIPFDTFFNDMNIIFIGAFPNQKEVLGLDIITKLADISQRYNVNNFGAMMKGHFDDNIKEVQQSFTSEFFSKAIKTNGEKYYVVGPSKFNEIVPRELQEVGVAKDKIMLV